MNESRCIQLEADALKEDIIEYLSNINYFDDFDDHIIYINSEDCIDFIDFIRKGKLYTVNSGIFNIKDLSDYELLMLFAKVTNRRSRKNLSFEV